MSVRRLFAGSIVSIVVIAAVACGASASIPQATSVDSLGDALESAGLRVQGPAANDFLSASYFSIPGVQYSASGEMVLAYEFTDSSELAAQKDLVSPDGWGIGNKFIQWTVAPSFFQNGNLIVVYDGEAKLIIETLTEAMGEPFAQSDPV